MSEEFYVYEHTRNDTNEIFYVGKGKVGSGRSTKILGRNQYWQNIVNKVGFNVHKKIVGIRDEELSFLIEVERISQLRELGYKLCNLTDGGEGASGHKHSTKTLARMSVLALARPAVTEETKARMSIANSNRSPETRARMSEAQIGEKSWMYGRTGKLAPMYDKKHSEKTLAEMSESRKGEGNSMYNKNHSSEARAKIADANSNPSPETRARMSASALAKPKITEEHRANLRASGLAKPVLTCPYCGKEGKAGAIHLWHFDRCLMNPAAPPRLPQQPLLVLTCPYCSKEGKGGVMTRWHFDNCKKKEL